MKIRQAFVANSSSSSFIISKEVLSGHQIDLIYEHTNHVDSNYDYWDIESLGGCLILTTMMDNFDMREYLVNTVGVKDEHIKWRDY